MALNESPSQQVTLPAPPPTLPPWAKVLWYVAETVAIGVSWKLFDYGQEIRGVTAEAGAAEATEWRRFSVHWDDLTSTEAADDQYHTFDIVNYTGGQVDSTWNTTDHDYVGASIANFIAAIAPNTCNRYQAITIKAYRMAYNDYSYVKPFAESGPPVYQRAVGSTGGGGSTTPPQCCTTVSERTPVRANWGRTYLPTIGSVMLSSGGRLTTAAVDAYAAAYAGLADQLHASDFFLVVPATSSNRAPVRALQNVTAIAVDDVVDIHRSRRHKHSTHTVIDPVPTPLEEPEQQPAA